MKGHPTMTTITAAPLDLSPGELDDLFGSSPAGDIPAGQAEGTAIFFAGTRGAKPFAKMARILLWQGKVFRPATHDLVNRLSPSL